MWYIDPWFPTTNPLNPVPRTQLGGPLYESDRTRTTTMHAIGHCCAVVSISHAKSLHTHTLYYSFSLFFFIFSLLYVLSASYTNTFPFSSSSTQAMDNPSSSTQARPCEKASSMKKRFLKRAKEHRSRLYILKRCIIMLLCWQKYEQYWYSKPLFSRWIPLTTSTPLFFFLFFLFLRKTLQVL